MGRKIARGIRIFFAVFFFIGAVIFLAVLLAELLAEDPASNVWQGFAIGAAVFVAIGILLLRAKGKSATEVAARKAEKEREAHTVHGKHTTGLPLAEGAQCTVLFHPDELEITGSGNVFRLPYTRMTSMEIKSDVEIQKSYVSSVGGAVAGAVLFGPLGAIVGGRAKEKTSRTTEYYLIVTYIRDNKIEYMSFCVSETAKVERLIQGVRSLFSSQATTVNL